MSARILVIDIETSPNLAYVWGLFNQNIGINQLFDVGEVLCFAAKWHDSSKVEFHSIYDFDKGLTTNEARELMIGAAWKLLDEADVVVHWNGKRFDIPWLQRMFLERGMAPPSPFKQLDLMNVVKKGMYFTSNKLDHVSQQLGVGKKVSTGGFELWLDCMFDDLTAWRKMRRYNINDVKITDAVYDKLIPWIPNHPHLGLFNGDMEKCGRCQVGELEKRGFKATSLGLYQQYRCKNCGSWSRGKKSLVLADARPTE